ncbi:MAG: hypothetical protein C0476_05955 [Sphingomonas sp.]|nr:hypothetical protein [Sphingomonas sp.]
MIRPLTLAFLLLGGCAQSGNRFPSLLPRAIEVRDDAEPMAAAPVIVPDAALDAGVDAAATDLAIIKSRFEAGAARAENLVAAARGQAAGSTAWLDAQSGLADLDVLRADVSSAMSDLDRLAIDRAAAGSAPYPALEGLRNDARAQYEDAGTIIETLAAQLAPA